MRLSSWVAKCIHSPCKQQRLGKGAVLWQKQSTRVQWIPKHPDSGLKGHGSLPFWPANFFCLWGEQPQTADASSTLGCFTELWICSQLFHLNNPTQIFCSTSKRPHMKQFSLLAFFMQWGKASLSAVGLLHQYTDLCGLSLLHPYGGCLQILLPWHIPGSASTSWALSWQFWMRHLSIPQGKTVPRRLLSGSNQDEDFGREILWHSSKVERS